MGLRCWENIFFWPDSCPRNLEWFQPLSLPTISKSHIQVLVQSKRKQKCFIIDWKRWLIQTNLSLISVIKNFSSCNTILIFWWKLGKPSIIIFNYLIVTSVIITFSLNNILNSYWILHTKTLAFVGASLNAVLK